MNRPLGEAANLAARRDETARAIRSAKRTADAIELLRTFEASIRRETSSPAPTDRPLMHARFAPDWLQEDLKRRELAEAERVLVNSTLQMDAAVLSGDDPGGIFERHTEQCTAVRRLRRQLERMQYADQ